MPVYRGPEVVQESDPQVVEFFPAKSRCLEGEVPDGEGDGQATEERRDKAATEP